MPEITMPRLSDTMEDGVVSAWLKQVGEQITRGEVVAEIETDKALMELEAYEDGVLEQILAAPGVRVPIGEPIAIVGDGSGTSAAAAPPADSAAATQPAETTPAQARPADPAPETPAVHSVPAAGADERKKSSPLARKIARELGVDLAAVAGTGPGGRVTRQDVEAAHRQAAASGTTAAPGQAAEPSPVAEAPSGPVSPASAPSVVAAQPVPATTDYEEIPLTNIQRVSAVRLTESKQQAPHIYLTSAIDVTDLFAFRAQLNTTLVAAGEGKVSVNDLLVKAVATTLRKDPAVNVSFAGDKLLRHRGIHLGVAVATPAGLLVPVLRDADRKSVSELAAESRDKAVRARERKLRADEMSGGTFTISNLGMFGIEQFTAVINPPESAILAVGAAADELRLADGAVVTRKILRVTLSADHRAVDGAVAAQFLAHLKDLLEQPLRIIA
ncbi:pyruvate dehydrogenase E2 component [Nocardia brasiliensis NBRC 14402]|uniref:dihydrolipoamide acetyltransferase family protein n=1 Tax=Nocardia brasiliensis TaxID=37326 RepID=UPI00031BFC0A|nr:dihydrolipoamide acetyltransferase family protein [Nocardia brasiliensis]GAJ83004.1 pyruvate dehydrogenase E2 component [Nocardia brasiliensis NBRC 14402]SUB54678.1 Dihydrolipoyllysine-residue acetyltransferase component of pyruvate dehydrogenase complex [Nocardia brasiliensis]